MKEEYAKIGFKCGLEIHQRIDTHKLFCSCYVDQAKPIVEKTTSVYRQLRAAAGESGIADVSALFEAANRRTFEYQCGEKTSCLVEADEEPPHLLNKEALQVALQVAKNLKAKPVDEIHVMRKTIIDGSAVSGFQRTALIALNGDLETKQGTVGIQTIAIEEESAGIVEKEAEKNHATYRLDRLGIPLIEIATDSTIRSPEHAREVALQLGTILRNTGKVQRGIGTIRQDVNVSIEIGARVEIKGAQELEAIDNIIENEVARQRKLLDIKKELINRGAKIEEKIVDVTKIFEKASGPVIRMAVQGGGKIMAARLTAFAGLLGKELLPNLRLGTELADRARASAGVKGIIHSDENLSVYGIDEKQVAQLCEALDVRKGDAFIICAEREDIARNALHFAMQRASQALQGVPSETRRTDGIITRFLRPIAGAARMYPETDALPFSITQEEWKEIQELESPGKKIERYKGLGLNQELARRMASHAKFKLFERAVQEARCDAVTAAVTLLETITALRRQRVEVEKISDDKIFETLQEFARGSIAKAGISEVLRHLALQLDHSVNKLISKYNLQKFEEEALRRIALENQGNIGEIMKKHKANIDPAQLVEVINKLKQSGKLQSEQK